MTNNHVPTIFYFPKCTISFRVYVRANRKTLQMYLRLNIKSFVSKKERKILEILTQQRVRISRTWKQKLTG